MQREPHVDIGRVIPAGTQGLSAAVAGTAQQHRLLLPIGIVRSAALLLRTTRRRPWRLSGAVAIIRLPSADA